ncbi:MAG: hypothetical protein ACYDCQ_07830 [Dehalococcoidia bacterium]
MLLGSNLLDFAIGLVLIYFLLSLFCSWVNEKIAGWTNLRAKTLVDGIEGLLPGIAADLLKHPLIRGMSNQHGKNGANAGGILNTPVQLATSYIDAHTFSTALIQQLTNAAAVMPVRTLFAQSHDQAASDAISQAVSNAAAQIHDTGYNSPAAQQSLNELDSAIQRLRASLAPGAGELVRPPITFESLRTSVASLPDDQTRRSLLALIDDAQGDLGRAQHNIEVWFDNAMERLSGWYKRRTQWIILAIAFVAVALVNADSFAIANELWHDDAARQAAVAEAQKVVQNAQPAGSTGATGATAGTGGSGAGCVQQNQAGLSCVFNDIQALRVPIGYTTTDPVSHMPVPWFGPRWRTLNFGSDWDIVAKLLGWVATAIAISLGAPFWFDLLTKLVNLRNTGEPPAPATPPATPPAAAPPGAGQAAR